MQIDILNKSGSSTGRKVTLPDDIFGIEPHEHAMWLMIETHLANQRQVRIARCRAARFLDRREAVSPKGHCAARGRLDQERTSSGWRNDARTAAT